MKSGLRKKLFFLLAGAALLLGSVCPAPGQFSGSRRVRVYNPGRYQRTRAATSRGAALRKALKKRQRHRAAGRRRHTRLAPKF